MELRRGGRGRRREPADRRQVGAAVPAGWRRGVDGPVVTARPPAASDAGALIALIRQLRVTHGLPAWALGRALGVPRSTVSAWLRRLGLNRPPTEPAAPVQRYEWPTAGDMMHVDIKPLGPHPPCRPSRPWRSAARSPGAGWEYVHVAIDDHTRLAYVEVLPDQRGPACARFSSAPSRGFRHAASRASA